MRCITYQKNCKILLTYVNKTEGPYMGKDPKGGGVCIQVEGNAALIRIH